MKKKVILPRFAHKHSWDQYQTIAMFFPKRVANLICHAQVKYLLLSHNLFLKATENHKLCMNNVILEIAQRINRIF